MLHTLLAFLVCVGMAWARDTTKGFKTMPAISNSLVNLGKMDISFHFNTKLPDNIPVVPELKVDSMAPPSSSFFLSKSEPFAEQEPCICSSLRNVKSSFLSNPTEIINKILMSNELFSYNKEPVTSINCCDSHEHVQEDTVFFEFGPKQNHMESPMQSNQMPIFPFLLDNILPKSSLPTGSVKPKAIEIFFFPKKKEMTTFDGKIFPKKKDMVKKPDIQIVGDKDLRNDFKSFKFRPSVPINSLKKDLKDFMPDKVDRETTTDITEEPTKVTVTFSQPNTV